jgi:integrase
MVMFMKHAEEHYRHLDGTPTNELSDFRYSLRPLKELYGLTTANLFGPLALLAVRQKMIALDWSRGVINQRIGRIRRMLRWATEQELVPPAIYHGLQAVRGLQRGRSAARETAPVGPVPEAIVHKILPKVRAQVKAMILVQLYSGMRPGEVVRMRGIDLDLSGRVWQYRPGSDQGPQGDHKMAYRGQARVIALGPKAQAVLKPWLRTGLMEWLFQPREAEAVRDQERRQARKTPMTPSQAARRPKKRPRRAPGPCYTTASYARAIARGCELAEVPHFHPNQLRHTAATLLRREVGLDAARVVLGHRSPQITEVYAELDQGKAITVMEKLG